ncbi:MAG: pyrroline-5-carboxylate reductase [Rhodospirillales bacterium]|jgi:pyrroline-5-carboxylate reductase|nr:pyrroline-5-carboxylate reductase [Rhodospirillales bacterium]
MRIGFIGTGNIAAATVRGLCTAVPAPDRVLVSPRNAEKAAALAAEFAQVEVAADNQAVVDGSECVIIAVRPPQVEPVISPLTFRPDQSVISLAAAVSLAALQKIVAPASRIVRAVPQPTVARHTGPIAVFPSDAEAVALLGRIGNVVPVDDEHHFDALCTVTAIAASQFAFLGRVAAWLTREGVEQKAAVRFTTAIAQTIATDADKAEAHGFDALIKEVSTPGGMNEQILRMMAEGGGFNPIDGALDAVLARYKK